MGVVLFFLLFLRRIYVGGNSTEEYSLLYVFISLYIFCKLFFSQEKITAKYAFVIGLCFSFLLWLRPNNELPIVAICIYLFFQYIVEKDFSSLKTLILYFILGQLPLTLLYASYFTYHNALYDLFYAAFLFNFKYIKSYLGFSSIFLWVNILMFLSLAVGSVLHFMTHKDKKVFFIALLLLVLNTLGTNIGGGEVNHYYINAAPSIIFGLILILNAIKSKRILSIAILSIILLASVRSFYYGYNDLTVSKEELATTYEERAKDYQRVFENIPLDEYTQVYFHEVYPEVYPLMNINPNYKHFTLQEWMASFDPHIFVKINDMLKETPPLWIVLRQPYYPANKYKNTEFVDILESKYVVRYEDNMHTLLMLENRQKNEFSHFNLAKE